jgi:crotonobetainyl-CoA:carnitine CoA-transferase CaiB-like acyl-CoA transferase
VTGDPDRPPARVAVSLTDYITGLYAAFGAVMALLHAKQTGVGQVVDASLYESAFSFMEPHVPAYEKLGVIANREGSRLPGSNPNNLYPTADQSFVHITAMADPVFRRLCEAMVQPGLANDPRFARARAREDNHDALDDLIGRWTSSLPVDEVEQRLEELHVPATRIYKMDDIFRDAQFKARDMLCAAPDADLGSITVAGPVPKLMSTPAEIRHAGRAVGADTHRILRDLLHFSSERIENLAAAKVVRLASGTLG